MWKGNRGTLIAKARAKAIRAEGDALAARYYEMLSKDTDLAIFLRDIESLEKILQKRTTIVIGADTYPFKLLRTRPDIESGITVNPDSK